jgi:hypothetical protein
MSPSRPNADDPARSQCGRPQSGPTTGDGDFWDGQVDYSQLSIHGWSARENRTDAHVSPTADVETQYGWDEKTALAMPILIELGATADATASGRRRRQDADETQRWEHVAIGAALAGVSVSCRPEVWRGLPVAPDTGTMPVARIVEAFDRYGRARGELLVQVGDDDVRRGVPEYLIQKHRLRTIELTWGRDAGDNGDPLRIGSLEEALACQQQGYTVVPDPSNPIVQECFADGLLAGFERHGRLGLLDEQGFLATCERLRGLGFRRIALRAGVGGLRELALILKWSSRARIDLVTLEGTGRVPEPYPIFLPFNSPSPDLHLHAAAAQFAARLAAKGERVPDLALAGSFHSEEDLFKALALGAPFVRAVQMEGIGSGVCPSSSSSRIAAHPELNNRFGEQLDAFYGCREKVAELVGSREMGGVPMAAVSVLARVQRLADGLRRIMAAARCFNVAGIGRSSLASLTRSCAEVTGIPCAADAYRAEAEAILER